MHLFSKRIDVTILFMLTFGFVRMMLNTRVVMPEQRQENKESREEKNRY